MTKGYLIFAQNNKNNDYVKMAYALALSIKISQSTVCSVSLVTDILDSVPKHYRSLFDHIIEIPWHDASLNSEWKIENRWKLYHITPYDETIVLDADMLFLSDVSSWWNYLSKNHDMCFVTKSMTYRNELTDDSYYRQVFIENNLPNLYSAFLYFKKTDSNLDFWTTVEMITKNWQIFYKKFLPNKTPVGLSMDVVFALAAKIHGIEGEITSNFNHPTITHMKTYAQRWKHVNGKWSEYVGSYLNNEGKLKIGNYQQYGIFHYTEKEFLKDDIVEIFENLYRRNVHG